MTPEQRSRQQIDRQLEQCGWRVQDMRDLNISADLGVAVREFPLKNGFADYLLYAGGRAIGVVEAKREGHPLMGVETQSSKYTDGLPSVLPHYHLPLPFAYESTGAVTQFTNALEPEARSRPVFTFHRPEELARLAGLDDQVRGLLEKLPPLVAGHLWRSFEYEEPMKQDNANLDIFWLKDKSLEDSDDLPEPEVLSQEIADDLQTALKQFNAIAEKLEG